MDVLLKNIKKEYLILSIILIITVIAFSPTFENDFTNLDDVSYVTQNPDLKLSWDEKLDSFFSKYYLGNYHPLTMVSLAIDYQIDGLNPMTFHITNLILHLINTLLVFWFILLLLKSVNYKRSLEIALITSALFGVHTLHVESVAWISERKDVLYSMFFLLSLIAYLKYVNIKKSKFLIFSLVLFLFSLLSKGQAVSLAVSLLAIDYFIGRKLLSKKVILEKIPFFVLSIIFGIIAINAQQGFDTIQNSSKLLFYERILFASNGFIQYLSKLFIPINLSAFYPYPEKIDGSFSLGLWLYFLGAIGVILLTVYLLKNRKKDFVFGILFFTINIFLVLQLFPVGNAIMADRYSYIPSIGVFLIIGFIYSKILKIKNSKLTIGINIFLVIYISFLTFQTINRTKIWNNSKSLWTDVIAKNDNIAIAHTNLGALYIDEDDIKAEECFLKAIEVDPNYTIAYNNIGFLNINKDTKKAEKYLLKAIEINPNYLYSYTNLANLYMKTDKELSKKYILIAQEIDPNNNYVIERVNTWNELWLKK